VTKHGAIAVRIKRNLTVRSPRRLMAGPVPLTRCWRFIRGLSREATPAMTPDRLEIRSDISARWPNARADVPRLPLHFDYRLKQTREFGHSHQQNPEFGFTSLRMQP
jgi:hypothetical protein